MPFSLATLPHRLQRWLNIDRRDRGRRDEAVTLGYSRIFILPTAQGLLFAAMAAVMLVGAANYNNNLAFLLAFLLIATGLVALVQTYQNLAGMTLRPSRCPPVFCGETARFEIAVSPVAASSGTAAPGAGSARRALGLRREQGASTWFDITAERVIAIELATERRGRLELGRLIVHTSYPLGLFRAQAHLNYSCAIIVYPRPAPAQALRPRDSERDSGTDDFIGHRSWSPGDPPRHVDWKAAARSGEMLNKQFGGDEHAERWLDWHEHHGFGTEERLSRLCREVLEAEAAGLRYGLRLPGMIVAPGTGGAQRNRCLRALALFEDLR